MRFVDLAQTSAAVAATSKRLVKIELLADCLRRLANSTLGPDGADPDGAGPDGVGPDGADAVAGDPGPASAEAVRVISAGAAYLAGELRQRQTGVGHASLRELPPPAVEPTLTVAAVDEAFARIAAVAGKGSQGQRRHLVVELFAAATAAERGMLIALLGGELRQGALGGVLTDALARAGDVDPALVRRALLLAGDLKIVAAAALTGGAAELARFRLTVGRPLAPMLAQSAATVGEALAATGFPAAADVKIDGVRIQVHRDGDEVAVFSRSLDDLTGRMPDVVAGVRALPLRSAVLDGEAVGLDAAGRALAFQETSSRAARRDGVSVLHPFFFDLLHLDGVDLLDRPSAQRWAALSEVVPAGMRVDRFVVSTVAEAERVFVEAVTAGHEGLVLKAAGAAYDVGRRGAAWVKVKPRHTLDLVVLAAEWGHGRRRGWLSNLHLGARDRDQGGFIMLGKTFKGMTDDMLRWQTDRLREIATEQDDWVVRVRPELVVEIAFDGVQTSSRYPGGVALRFARVLRYREDKRAEEADTIDAVRALHR